MTEWHLILTANNLSLIQCSFKQSSAVLYPPPRTSTAHSCWVLLLLQLTSWGPWPTLGDFSRVWKQKCEHISSNNWIPQTGFCRKAKQKIHSSKQYSSIKCDFLEDPSQSSDLNPTEMLWKDIKYKMNTFTNPCKYVIEFHVIVQQSDQIQIQKKW